MVSVGVKPRVSFQRLSVKALVYPADFLSDRSNFLISASLPIHPLALCRFHTTYPDNFIWKSRLLFTSMKHGYEMICEGEKKTNELNSPSCTKRSRLIRTTLTAAERPRSIFWLSRAIRSVAAGNQWSKPVKSVLKWFHWSAPPVSRTNWSDRTTESDTGSRPYEARLLSFVSRHPR